MVQVEAIRIEQITAVQAEAQLMALIRLLQNVVNDGASIGFIAPLSDGEARDYWLGVLPAIAQGHKLLFTATLEDQVVGSVQLALEPRRGVVHCAEVQKLMVHTAYRGHGLGRRLMNALEQAAQMEQRSLLVLDTRRGDVAEGLYQRMGYTQAGVIPGYALSSDGKLHDTVFYYRQLYDTWYTTYDNEAVL
jgi:acetyltransferase